MGGAEKCISRPNELLSEDSFISIHLLERVISTDVYSLFCLFHPSISVMESLIFTGFMVILN